MERINNDKAIEFLLAKEWEKEFEIQDNLNQHRNGMSFDYWCEKKGLIEEKKRLIEEWKPKV